MTFVISYLFYPFIALLSIGFAWMNVSSGHNLQTAFTVFAAVRFMLFLLVEWQWPAHKNWAITWRSFLRDVKYMIAGGALGQFSKFAIGWLTIGAAGAGHGPISGLPLWLQVLLVVLGYELVQYWLHRLSHEAKGPIGRFLWRIHVVHHLPRRVYFLMHPVMHPINLLMTISIGLIPVYVLGADKEAVFVFNLLLGLQGLFSHFNAPIKAGPLNYLLVGTELHRLHHSANLAEAGNYGVLTPVWDLLFGSYVPAGKHMPAELGVVAAEQYPSSNAFWRCLLLPLRANGHYGQPKDEP